MPESESGARRGSALACAAAVMVLAAPDLLHGTPGRLRFGWVGLLALLAGLSVRWLERHPEPSWPPEAERTGGGGALLLRWDLGVAVGLMVYALLTFLAVSWLFGQAGAQLMPQDTGYFEQCIWSTLHGKGFFAGSSQQLWRYDPPLTSHFAMHASPALLGVVGLYAVWPSYHALHAVQVLAITLGAVPLWWCWRKQAPRLGVLWVMAYLLHAAVLSQTQLSFHELTLAVPGVALLTYGWLAEKRGLALAGGVLSLLAREDLALLVCMAGGLGVVLKSGRSRWFWGSMVLLGLAGFGVASAVMKSFGASGGQVILSLFSRFGRTPGEIVAGMVRQPGAVLELLLEGHRVDYLIGLARPGLLGALMTPVSLFILPALGINLLVRGAGTAWLDVHYSVYMPPVLMLGAAWVWRSPPAWLGRWVTPARLGGMLLPLSLLGLPGVFTVERLQEYLPSTEAEELDALLRQVPPDARLAVPRHALHLAATRERLYIVNRVAEYTLWDAEYLLVDRNPHRWALRDGTAAAYAAFTATLEQSIRFERLAEGPHFRLYRDRQSRPAALGEDGKLLHPARAPTTAGPAPVLHPPERIRDAP